MARILGLDIGIGSCGWGFIEPETFDPATGELTAEQRVVACGARCFEIPEEPKTKELKNKRRRQLRGQRRVTRRRRQRLAGIRRLLAAHGLPGAPPPLPIGTKAGHVWHLRAEALDRVISAEELARVLLHLAKHRGFKSNSRREQANETSDTGKMLEAVTALDTRSAGWRTVGEMLARDPEFQTRKRNAPGDYSHTLLRRRVEEETTRIFDVQRRFCNAFATDGLERAYVEMAFFQLPLRSSVEAVGRCRFETAELRAPRHAPSFELFRFLSRLNNLRLAERGRSPRGLAPQEWQVVRGLFGTKQKLTFKDLRKALKLPESIRFDGLPATKDPETATFTDATGTARMTAALGERRARELLAGDPALADAAMAAIVFHETDEEVRRELRAAGLVESDIAALLDRIETFANLRGTGHISALACRGLLPHLEAGEVYSEACRLAGYDHSALGVIDLDRLANPVVRKVIGETLKQLRVLFRTFGEPDLVHIEMARDIGKSASDRNELYRAGDKRRADRDRHRARYEELLEHPPNDEELLRYELWLEQGEHCLYSNEYISPAQLVATDNSVQIDHILPYSRSGDDSFRNKALVTAKANQDKRNQTLWEWFGESDPKRWEDLETRIGLLRKANRLHKEKARKLLLKSFAERESGYRDRHLNDTRYSVRVLRMLIEQHWPGLATKAGERRIFTRPGAITAMVRRGLGLDEAKQSGALGDRDHALDALVIAWTTEAALNRLTREHQNLEWQGRPGHVPSMIADRQDREKLRRMFLEAAEAVFVSRSETRRGRGPAHDATLYGIEHKADGREIQYARTPVVDLRHSDLDRLKGDPLRGAPLRAVLAAWLDRAGREKLKPAKLFDTDPPRMPTTNGEAGPIVRHVYLARPKMRSGIKLWRGEAKAHADLETMVRVDVFEKNQKYFLVPIYAWQLMDKRRWPTPPSRPIMAHVLEQEWKPVDSNFYFKFSLYSGSYVDMGLSSGEILGGYYRTVDRSDGQIAFSIPWQYDSKFQQWKGTKTLRSFRKFHVDRLGNRFEIHKEPRLWHGEVCS